MTETTQETIDKLRGTYRIPITDGLGPAGGEEPSNADFFVRSFPTSPLALRAADLIERLEAELGQCKQDNGDWTYQIQVLKAKMAVLEEENDKLRGIIANSDSCCLYCGLSKEDMNKCESGFPGCGRADDMLLTMDFTEELPEPREPEAQDDNETNQGL